VRLATKWLTRTGSGSARIWRGRLGTVLIALLAVWGSMTLYQLTELERQEADPYGIAAQGERFAAIAARVPPGEILGYTSDQALDGTAGQAMFFGAQYALAPRLLTGDSKRGNPRYVLGNFSKQLDVAAWGAVLGLRVAAEPGSGVVLFEREHR
jgi:hypothetical protein